MCTGCHKEINTKKRLMIVIFFHGLLLTFWLALAVTMTSAEIPFLSKVCNHNCVLTTAVKHMDILVLYYIVVPTCVKERNRIPKIFALICKLGGKNASWGSTWIWFASWARNKSKLIFESARYRGIVSYYFVCTLFRTNESEQSLTSFMT